MTETKTDRVEAREGYFEVSKTVLGKEEQTIERIQIRPFVTTPATVSVKAGATVNLGNYESGRVDVMLAVPCYLEEIDEVFVQAKQWVDDRVAQEYKEMKESTS